MKEAVDFINYSEEDKENKRAPESQILSMI